MTELASRRQLRAALMRWALVLVPGVLLLGLLSSVVAGGNGGAGGAGPGGAWFAALDKPGFYPPGAIFGIVWSVLYALMGFALAIVITAWGARGRQPAIVLFVVQLLANLAWAPLFFGAHRIGAAVALLVLLDVLVAVTLVLFQRVRPLAAALLLPYLAWIVFATVLCWQIWVLNPGADGQAGGTAVVRMRIGS